MEVGFVTIALVSVLIGVWITPLVFILKSDRTTGLRKIIWVLALIFVSWFAWLAYIVLVPKPRDSHQATVKVHITSSAL